MAEFTEFNAPIGVAGPISVRRATAEDFGGGARLVSAGKALGQFGELLKKNQVKRENAGINQSNIDNQGYGAELFRQARENTDVNATDFTTNVLAEYDRNMEVQLANAPNDRVRTEMKANFTRTRNTLVEKSAVFESMTRSKNEVNVFVANGDKVGNLIYGNPTEQQYQELLAARTNEINNTSLPDHIKQEFLRDEVKNLRFKQFSGLLDTAVTPDQVDEILAQRPEDELSQEAFTQLGKAGLAKQRRFKIEARLAAVERNQDIRDARAQIRVANKQLSEGRIPDEATLAYTETLVGGVQDATTDEMWFNVRTVGKAVNGWMKLPSADLEAIIVGLEQDTVTGGATTLEGALLDAARSVLFRTLTGEQADQVEVDKSVQEIFDSMDKRLAHGDDLSSDPNLIAMVALLPQASPRLQQQIGEALVENKMVDGLMDMSTADLVALFNDANANSALSDYKIVELLTLKRVLAAMVTTTEKNYLDWIQKTDPAVFPPLDESSPASMRTRETLMLSGATKYGKEPQFHTTSEIKNIGDRIPEMSSDEQLAFINGYTANMGTENAMIALTELAEVNPQLAFVGSGIASNPSYLVTGTRILRGQQMLNNEGGSRIEDATSVTKADMETAIGSALMGALENENLHPQHRAAVKSAALALIAFGTESDPVRALNTVLGGTNDGYGGVQEFNHKTYVAPVGVKVEMMGHAFADHPTSITELSVDGFAPRTSSGEPITGETIDDAGVFEQVGPDMYVVRMTSDGLLLQGAPGTPYTVHITRERLLALGVKD
jgi:hypothetical protein